MSQSEHIVPDGTVKPFLWSQLRSRHGCLQQRVGGSIPSRRANPFLIIRSPGFILEGPAYP